MRNLRLIPAVLLMLFLVACSSTSGVKIDNSWQNGDYTGGRLDNILIVGLGQNPENVRHWEDQFVAALKRAGHKSTAAYTVFTEEIPTDVGPGDLEEAKQKIMDLGFDGVILGKIRDVESGPVVEGGETHVIQTPSYYSFYSYYRPQQYTVQDRTRVVNIDRVRVETNIYAIEGEVLVYTAMIDSTNMPDVQKAIKGLVDAVMKDLKSRKML